MIKKGIILLVGSLLFWQALPLQAQEAGSSDPTVINDLEEMTDQLLADEDLELIPTTNHDPNLASLYSAALPGLGQAYNSMYWKVPIVYGGLALTVYFIRFNNIQYLEYRRLLFAELDGDPTTINDSPLTTEALERNTDNWRRNRDFMIIMTGLVYLLNIVDAHVDAHFRDFDVSEDLSLRFNPSVKQMALGGSPVPGISLSLQIK